MDKYELEYEIENHQIALKQAKKADEKAYHTKQIKALREQEAKLDE